MQRKGPASLRSRLFSSGRQAENPDCQAKNRGRWVENPDFQADNRGRWAEYPESRLKTVVNGAKIPIFKPATAVDGPKIPKVGQKPWWTGRKSRKSAKNRGRRAENPDCQAGNRGGRAENPESCPPLVHLKYRSHKSAETSANKGFKAVENLFMDFSEILARNCGEMRTFTAVYIIKVQMAEKETTYHIPVLLKPSVDGMDIRPDGTYVDVTFGGGGHSREILSRLGDGGRLLSFDQDEDAERNIVDDPHFTFVRSNFRYLHNFLRYYGVTQVDGILADLGVSSHHFDDSERGFSFRFDGQLDMRMNKRAGLTAADVVNTYDEERLADIFYLYGELKNSRKLASLLVKIRAAQKIVTIGDFLDIVKPLFGREREKKELAKVFQALRIEVNQEMEALKEMLYAATEALRPGGRLVVITYHSLEDRMVKNIMKTGNVEGRAEQDFYGNVQTPFRLVNNKVIVPDAEEIARNPRSRSAKLRIAEKR